MTAFNLELARLNMVESQVRTWDVTDTRVLELVARAPREEYVPAQYRNLAFVDMAIPLGHGQVMMHPKLEARLLQALEINPKDKILEVGTGSGYMTALLAALGNHVFSVEIFPDLSSDAAHKLDAHGIKNVTLEIGDGARGWNRSAPYDVILVTGSLPILPERFPQALAANGRMIAIVGAAPAMAVKLVRRLDHGGFHETTLLETDLPSLLNAETPAAFVF